MKKYIIFSLLTLFIAACSNEDYVSESSKKYIDNNNDSIITLQERDPTISKIWSKKVPKLTRSSRMFIPLEDYTGYGYSVGNSILGDYDNIGHPVVDLDKLRAKFKKPISNIKSATSYVTKDAYTSFDRYEKNTSVVNTVKTGFTVNLGLFKLGRTTTQTETFKTSNITESKRVYGEIGIELRHGQFMLNTTDVVLKTIASECLDEIFLLSLYSTPISEILDDFGPLVVTGYYTGGRASALYVAESDYTFQYESTEKDMTEHLEASFSWGKKGLPKDSMNSATGSLDFGENTGNNVSTTNTVTNLHCSVRTIGGLGTVDVPSEKIEDTDINLTPWMRTLENEDTHVMIGIQDKNGLTGLSEFVLEENFKQRIQDSHMEYTSNSELLEPVIEIVKVYVRASSSGEKLYEIAPILYTRQGDLIILSDGKASTATDADLKANNDYDTFMAKSKIISNEKGRFYKCEIRANSKKVVNPYLRMPLNMTLSGLNESGMYKFKNESTNIVYIYDSVARYAYSYYDDPYIPEAYGINSWIETIPEKNISLIALYQRYRIIGL